jgi:hypothetical protein
MVIVETADAGWWRRVAGAGREEARHRIKAAGRMEHAAHAARKERLE